ncbi:MAG: amino acid adenylation domain-containing protein [Marinifilaceae bacterium]
MERLKSTKYNIEKNLRKKEKDFWLEKLGDDFKKTTIPFDRIKSSTLEKDNSVTFLLDDNISEEIIKLGKDSNPRILVVLVSGLTVLLSELNQNCDELVMGMPIYEDESDIDPLNSVVPFHINLKNAKTCKDLLNSVKNAIKEGVENCAYPIDALPELLKLDYEKGEAFPIFDIAFNFEGIQNKKRLSNYNYNVLFNFCVVNRRIEIRIEYNSSFYEEQSIKNIGDIYRHMLNELVGDLNKDLATIDVISSAQKEKILIEFNSAKENFASESSISDLFEQQAMEWPDRIALVHHDASITYGDLNARSNYLARELRSKGVKQDVLVGLMCERNFDLFVGILGILKAGGGYLSIDINSPEDRVNYMIKDSGIDLVLGHLEFLHTLRGDIKKLDIDDFKGTIKENEFRNTSYNPNQIAYVLYTSGTTGFPKAIVTEHKNVVSYCNVFLQELKFQSEDIILQQASHSFDTFTEEVFPMLFSGGKIIVADADLVRNVPKLGDYILKNSVSVIDCSPLLISELGVRLPAKNCLRKIISGGDVLKGQYLPNFSSKVECYNTYGPTEATVCSTFYKCKQTMEGDIPIGKPFSNCKVFILNENLKLVPIGYRGEICMEGDGIARGYLNKVELTNERFVTNPYNEKERLYKSGDVGNYGSDGMIRFCGRKDNQINLRGFRIELGEVENQLLRHPHISKVVVIPIERDDEKWICAYFVSKEVVTEKQVREYLLKVLPQFMVPSFIIKVDEIPTNSNGKLCVKSLPNPFENNDDTLYFIDNDTIISMEENLNKLTRKIKKSNTLHIESVEVAEEEKKKLLSDFNDTSHALDRDRHYSELFEEQVKRTPDSIAIVFKDIHYTYDQLNRRANSLAFELKRKGIQSNSIVGLLCQRSSNMLVGILAILKSGAAFMPLEEEAPDERIAYIVSNTSPHLILVDEKNAGRVLNANMVNMSRFDFSHHQDKKVVFTGSFDNITHVLHTSGTTGKPKGVLINNSSILNLFNYVGDLLQLNESDCVLTLTPVTFDVFSAETLLPLIKGSRVYIVDGGVSLDIQQVLSLIQKEKISFLQCSPTGLQKLIGEDNSNICLKNVKFIISAGEPLLDVTKEKFTSVTNTLLYNLYGPTETTLYSTGKNVTGDNNLNIGSPIYNTEIRILDCQKNLLPIGKEGEIFIGGTGVSKGYVNQPELTFEMFTNLDGKRFYKTGDLAKWLPDGDIEFLGRIDDQIQLGGVRIEPAELENTILSYADVNEVAVVVKEDEKGSKYLMACLVADTSIKESEIRRFLTQNLPLYLVPRKIIQLEKMPYNSSRKIHRKLLELLDDSYVVRGKFGEPETEVEKRLVEIWADVLNLPQEKISVTSSFFSMGGHSLKAISLVSRIHAAFDVEVTLVEVFNYPSIRQIADLIEASKLNVKEEDVELLEYDNIRI